MILTDLQRATIRAIVSLFETGSPRGDYAQVTLAAGDSGGLSYGIHQATRASGNLGLLVQAYREDVRALYADELRPFLAPLLDADPTLDNHGHLQSLLRIAAVDDPVMRETQDAFFDRVFLDPAIRECRRRGFVHALTACVVYDSFIHGSFARIARQVKALGAKEWTREYIDKRHQWLERHSNPLLRRTVYRPDTLRSLAAASAWTLPLPLTVRGVLLTPERVRGETDQHASADESRLLRLRDPAMTGDDVREVQRALTIIAPEIKLDGVYGRLTDAGVRLYQSQHGLRPDGIVGPATRVVMGL